MRAPVLFAVIVAAALLQTAAAMAQDRVALVIGNAAYEHVPSLENTINDATTIGQTFERLGFEVTLATDQSHGEFLQALNEFRQKAARSRIAVVFYAGHGIEVDRTNYLIPIDARLRSDGDVEFESISLDLVLRAVEGAARLRLVILDACRDNPFLVRMERQVASRSIGRGLARVEPARDTLVAFAAREGTTASDGVQGEHSPFTAALLQHLETPDLEINFLFRKVRDAVLAATGGRQEPFTYGSLSGEEFYLNDSGATTAAEPGNIGDAGEDLLWTAVLRNGRLPGFKRYLEEFPDGKFAKEAKVWIEVLEPKAGPAGGGSQSTPPVDANAAVPAPAGPETEQAALDPGLTPADEAIKSENPPILECDRLAADPVDPARVTAGVAWDALDAAAAIAACREATGAFPKADRLAYQLARALHKGEAYGEALPILEGLVARGYEIAALNLGVLYGEGKGVARDYARARAYYEQAAAAGHPAAMGNLGLIYYRGNGVARDYAAAREWFIRAAEHGSSEAMYNLAVIHGRGDGVPVSMTEAARWMFKALAYGNRSALKAMTENAGATTAEFRRQLQRQLRDSGYYAGGIDGRFGPGTKRAITALAEAAPERPAP